MPTLPQGSYENYTFTGDVIAVAICIVIGILINTSYVNRTKAFRIFQTIIVSTVIASVVNIIYHILINGFLSVSIAWIYILRVVYQMCLFDILFLFALYITEVSGMPHNKARAVAISATVISVAGFSTSSTTSKFW